jgi:hypothetical protein
MQYLQKCNRARNHQLTTVLALGENPNALFKEHSSRDVLTSDLHMTSFILPGVLHLPRPRPTLNQKSYPGGTTALAAAPGPIRAIVANSTLPVQLGFAVDTNGKVLDARVIPRHFSAIEHSAMKTAHRIIVHQTGGSTAQSTFNSYSKKGAHGAHFLIDKDGTVYQTASLYKSTHHVGLLKPRCVLEKACSPVEIKRLGALKPK